MASARWSVANHRLHRVTAAAILADREGRQVELAGEGDAMWKPVIVVVIASVSLSVVDASAQVAVPRAVDGPTYVGDLIPFASPWIDLRSRGASFDGRLDNTPFLNRTIEAACASRYAPLFAPNGIGAFGTKPRNIGCGSKIFGAGARSSNDNGGTNFLFKYDGASESSGDLQWDGSGPGNSNGTGGGLWHATLEAETGRQRGAFIALTGTNADCSNSRPGHMSFTDVLLGGGNQRGTRDHAAYVDGTCATVAGSAGIRDVDWNDVYFTNATAPDQTILCKGCVHHRFAGGQVYTGAGAGPGVTITGAAGPNQFSDDVRMDKLTIYGNLVFDYARHSEFDGRVTGNVTITNNSENIRVTGQVDGTIDDQGRNTFLLTNQRISLPVARGAGYINVGPRPDAITGGDIAASRANAEGALFLGGDGAGLLLRPADNRLYINAGTGTGAGSQTIILGTPGHPHVGHLKLHQLTAAGPITAAGRATFTGGVQFPIAFTNAAQSDGAGQISLRGSTSATYTFSGTYTMPPLCTITPTSDPTAVGGYWASATTTTLTVGTHTAGTITFTYHCVARM